MDKRFDFKNVDAKWSKHWVENHCFRAVADDSKESYTVMIPPPNVTGILHMGHALNNTLQDIIVRYKRMKGFSTLWMPGTDHAGIATQNVVEKQLAKEGKTRHDVGREVLLDRLWEWKKKYGGTIIHQLEKLGASCDWERTRFTMDDDYSEAVKKVFIELFNKGLIYQGRYIINWCPRCHTALSDEEAEHQEHQGSLTHIRYPFKNNLEEYIIVATTRPETMLGDTAVAVNPNDPRYQDKIGQTLILPLMNREIKIIADDFVDPSFGTGAVKVTPAHDPNDYGMGQRHHLEFINILNDNGSINENGGEFEGLDRFDARKKIIECLKDKQLFEKVENHTHSVGHCYRCNTIIEPYLSKQWFVKMQPLAEPALKVVQDGTIKFYPEHWTNVYTNWMENIRDWCISRQIWWGHRIPVWYDDDGNIYAAQNEEEAKKQAHSKIGKDVPLKQDEDVLDTWFSSWLWPFATLHWPTEEGNKDLSYFYPGSSLFTASEIIFFWVARMIMAGLEFRGDVPFTDVYIHGTVRDEKGQKMSKSLGNALDPLEIIEEYGADALRFSLIMNSGTDLYISKDKFEIGRNFANKIWNATRLILMNIDQNNRGKTLEELTKEPLDLPSQWIISRYIESVNSVGKAIEQFKYSEAENYIYEFFWNNFCDWYLEIIKNRWNDQTVQNIAFRILEGSLLMMHPFIPFVTEEIWEQLNISKSELCLQSWPDLSPDLIHTQSNDQMKTIIEIVSALRNIRAQWNIKKNEPIDCFLGSSDEYSIALLNTNCTLIKNLVKIDQLTIDKNLEQQKNSATAIVGNIKCIVPLGKVIDIEQEKKKIQEQIKEHQQLTLNLSKRLENKSFIERAPEDIVNKEREKLAALENKVTELHQVMSSLD